jgi:hypothetical protein
MPNLLRNAGFEGDFRAWNGMTDISVAEGWLPFWVAQQPSDEEWKNRRPVYRAAPRSLDARRVRTGQASQMYYTSWATHIAGIMQTVPATPGQRLRLTAYGHAWSTDADTPDQSANPGHVLMKVGIDPAGALNPFAETVVWSPERAVYDTYDAGFTVEVVASGAQITVFLLSAPQWPKKHNDIYWDDVELGLVTAAGIVPGGDVLLELTSATHQAGTPVQVSASSRTSLTSVQLIVSGPAGAVDARYRGIEQGAEGFVWRWEFVPSVEGPYTATLSADGLQAVSASLRIAGATAPSTSPAPPSSTAAQPASASGRGQPRAQYHRVYVLLPPSAGKEWVQAILDSGVWERERWTVGFSADDAGIGDLDRRTVLVINPSAWPDPIIPWLEMWYPQVALQPVTAVSPASLREVLQSLNSGAAPELG